MEQPQGRGFCCCYCRIWNVTASNPPHAYPPVLQDLADACEAQGGLAAWRRSAIFADETGRSAWTPLAAYMLGEVTDLTTALAAALPSGA